MTRIDHKMKPKSTTIVVTDADGNIKTFTGWEKLKLIDCNMNIQYIRSKWSASDKSGQIEHNGLLIQKCIDNQ